MRIMGYFFSTGQNRALLAAPLLRAWPWRGGCRLPAYPRVRQLRLMMPTTLPQGVLPEGSLSSGGSPAAICTMNRDCQPATGKVQLSAPMVGLSKAVWFCLPARGMKGSACRGMQVAALRPPVTSWAARLHQQAWKPVTGSWPPGLLSATREQLRPCNLSCPAQCSLACMHACIAAVLLMTGSGGGGARPTKGPGHICESCRWGGPKVTVMRSHQLDGAAWRLYRHCQNTGIT